MRHNNSAIIDEKQSYATKQSCSIKELASIAALLHESDISQLNLKPSTKIE